MGTQPNPAPRLVFGPFEYDTVSGDLRKHRTRIRLQGKPLQILALLLDRYGEIVGRDELQRHLWGGATFVDFEQGLNAAVNKLRQALGDFADQPRYIETVSGRGYRFIAPIQKPSVKPVLEMAPRPKPRKSWLPWVASLAIAAVGTATYLLAVRRDPPAESSKTTTFTVAPPPGFALEGASSRQAFALSPDGSRLAFTAMDASGSFHIFLRDFNSVDPREIPNTSGAHTLFWPPDGQSLFFTAQGKVRRWALGADSQQVLCDSPSFMLSGAWFSPGKLLMGGTQSTYAVSASGGTPEQLDQIYRWPQALPDGQHVLYLRPDAPRGAHRARVERLGDPASAKDLIESDSRVLYTASASKPDSGYLIYIRAGSLLAQPFDAHSLRTTGEAAPIVGKVYSFFSTGAADFSVSDRGVVAYQNYASRSQLAWVDREGRQTGVIGPANVNVKSGRLSPDGNKLATAIYDVERGAQDLWIFDTHTGAARRLTLEKAIRDAPVWSPDSKRLAYLHSVVGRSPRIAIRSLGENDTEEILPGDGFNSPTNWSPDGRFIAYSNTGFPRYANEAQGDVWLVDLAHDRKQIPLLNSSFHEANAAFSPDGKWLAFTSNESGQPEVYIQAFQATDAPKMIGERFLVSRAGAQALRWRRDGKELFYLGFDGRGHGVPIKLSSKPEIGQATPLFSINIEARAAIHSFLGFDVSTDGARFVIPVVSSPDPLSIVVVQNWEAALPHRR